jgi:hypothetical protein
VFGLSATSICNALTRCAKLAVFDLAKCPAGLTEGSGACVDRSDALATLWVFLDLLRALVSLAAMSYLLELSPQKVRQRPSRFELTLSFGRGKLAFLLPLAIPEPFPALLKPFPTVVGATILSLELMAAMLFFT